MLRSASDDVEPSICDIAALSSVDFTSPSERTSILSRKRPNRVASEFKTHHHVLEADEVSLREALQILRDHLDEPLADPAVLPTFLMSRFARSPQGLAARAQRRRY